MKKSNRIRINHLKESGFTLVELMVVVVVIAILASIAYPSYLDSVNKGRRADCQAVVNQVAQFEQRWFNASDAYLPSSTGGGLSPGYPTNLTQCPVTGTALYNISVTQNGGATPDTRSYLINAIPVAGGAMASDPCLGYRLTNTGQKGAVSTAADAGFTTVDQTCWR